MVVEENDTEKILDTVVEKDFGNFPKGFSVVGERPEPLAGVPEPEAGNCSALRRKGESGMPS